MSDSNISSVLKPYISERIPKKITNVFWNMFNGIEAMFLNLEYKLNIFKRERNILTAKNLSSLRYLASENGFEPSLKIPSKGLLKLTVNPKLFNRCGYPLFIPPYSKFTDTTSKLTYYYNSEKTFRIDNSINLIISVIEGSIVTKSFVATSDYINRIYLTDENIADGSISIEVNENKFIEVKSFIDNDGENNDKQFMVKFSNDSQNPIILYIKGLEYKSIINISYRLTAGELGNINGVHEFTTEDIIDIQSVEISPDDNELTIKNISGFNFGSNGTDENSLRSAIGYNSGSVLLFDSNTYTKFLSKYSTLIIQKIEPDENEKTIVNIFIGKKQSLNISTTNFVQIIKEYKAILNTNFYLLTKTEKTELSNIINEFEYCLSSNYIYDLITCKFAFQINMSSISDINNYTDDIEKLLYTEFIKFMYIKNYVLNIETLFKDFMSVNNILFTYQIFNQLDEEEKISNSTEIFTNYIITNKNYLPLLKGDFDIIDNSANKLKLFFDINIVLNS
jgi:hypothetical protein